MPVHSENHLAFFQGGSP